MKYRPINHQEAVIFDLYTKKRMVKCVGCGGFLNRKEGKGRDRVVTERIRDLLNEDVEQIGNLRLVHFRCKKKGRRGERESNAKVLAGTGKSPRQVAEEMGLSLATVYNYLKKEELPQSPTVNPSEDEW